VLAVTDKEKILDMYKEVFQAGDRTEFLEKSRLEF
jgi:hypothetical protein